MDKQAQKSAKKLCEKLKNDEPLLGLVGNAKQELLALVTAPGVQAARFKSGKSVDLKSGKPV